MDNGPSDTFSGWVIELGYVIPVQETGTRSELTQATYDRFREASERYGEDAGEMTVCKLIEDDAGVNLRVEANWPAPWEVKHADDRS